MTDKGTGLLAQIFSGASGVIAFFNDLNVILETCLIASGIAGSVYGWYKLLNKRK